MALFNVTSNKAAVANQPIRDFKTSNMNIHIDTLYLTISELQITEQEWLGNF
jgi:hypothetical protein